MHEGLRGLCLFLAHSLLTHCLLIPLADDAGAAGILLDDGLAAPNPLNVIDSADDYSGDSVFVRNVACPPGGNPGGPCPSPGAPTDVGVLEDGSSPHLSISDSSNLKIAGGVAGSVQTYNFPNASLTGGWINTASAHGSSSISISGSRYVDAMIWAHDYATITLADLQVGGLRARGSSTLIMASGGAVGASILGHSVLTKSDGSNGGTTAHDSAKIVMNGGDTSYLPGRGASAVTLIGHPQP